MDKHIVEAYSRGLLGLGKRALNVRIIWFSFGSFGSGSFSSSAESKSVVQLWLLWRLLQLLLPLDKSLPADIYSLVNHHRVAKDLWEIVQLLMQESPLVDSGLVVPVFSPGDDPIACLNKAMAFPTVVASLRQCTQPKRPRNAAWYKDKAMLAEAQEAGQILDEEQPGISCRSRGSRRSSYSDNHSKQ
nr:hypothetical protein [Tanacetum cinerariifolium]